MKVSIQKWMDVEIKNDLPPPAPAVGPLILCFPLNSPVRFGGGDRERPFNKRRRRATSSSGGKIK